MRSTFKGSRPVSRTTCHQSTRPGYWETRGASTGGLRTPGAADDGPAVSSPARRGALGAPRATRPSVRWWTASGHLRCGWAIGANVSGHSSCWPTPTYRTPRRSRTVGYARKARSQPSCTASAGGSSHKRQGARSSAQRLRAQKQHAPPTSPFGDAPCLVTLPDSSIRAYAPARLLKSGIVKISVAGCSALGQLAAKRCYRPPRHPARWF